MPTSKKILITAISLLLAVVTISALIIEPMIRSGDPYYLDGDRRKELSGSLNILFIGDSDGMTAFSPRIFDDATSSRSYNLSNTMMLYPSRYYLLKKETGRNPIDTVFIQISIETLGRKNTNYGDGDSVFIQRLDSFGERLEYMIRYVSLDDWLNIYSRLLSSGISWWKDKMSGSDSTQRNEEDGFHPSTAHDQTLSNSIISEMLDSIPFELDFYQPSIDMLTQMVQFCKNKGIKVIILNLPASDACVWQMADWDEYLKWARAFCEDNQVEYFDFNLLKDRNLILNDFDSYKDTVHMSRKAGEAFTEVLADLWRSLNAGKNCDYLFYDNYSEVKRASPYNIFNDVA